MPMGIKNSPATFQRMMNDILSPLSDICVPVLDDVVCFAASMEAMTAGLESLFSLLHQTQIYLSPSKACLYQTQIDFYGAPRRQRRPHMSSCAPRNFSPFLNGFMYRTPHKHHFFSTLPLTAEDGLSLVGGV